LRPKTGLEKVCALKQKASSGEPPSKPATGAPTHLDVHEVEGGLEESGHVEGHSANDDGQQVLQQSPANGVAVVHGLLVVQRVVYGHISV